MSAAYRRLRIRIHGQRASMDVKKLQRGDGGFNMDQGRSAMNAGELR
jgi:hypothetical protein